MSYNNAISSGDPQAVEKLTAKLEQCKTLQQTMKAVNAYYKKHGTCRGFPDMSDAAAAKLDSTVGSRSWITQPYDSYQLTNNNAEIHRLEKRIAEVTRNQEVGFAGWEFAGGTAEANTEANRLQIFFDERPDKTKHEAMRHAGFVYSHQNGAYQRQLNDNAIWAASNLSFVKPSDGRTVREHQPKVPARDTGAR
jgi:hypothetical protein